MRKLVSSFMIFILLFSMLGNSEVDAFNVLKNNPDEPLLERQIEKTDEKITQYLQSEIVSKEVFKKMSNEEQDTYIKDMLNSEKYIQLEKELMENESLNTFTRDNNTVSTFALPLIAPVAAFVARVALQTIIDKGSDFTKKYLKENLDNIGDNYEILWTQPNSLVVVLQGSGKNKQRVFAIDYTTIPLKPGSTKKIWHYHITPDIGMHHTLCSFIPEGHKPDTRTTCY